MRAAPLSPPDRRSRSPGKGSFRFTRLGCPQVLCCVGNLNRLVPNYAMHLWMATPDRGLAATLQELGIDIRAEEQKEGRIVCKCFNLTEPYIRRKIRELKLHTIPEITGAIKAGGACMSCHHVPGGLQDLLDEVWGRQPTKLVVLPQLSEQKETVRPAAERPALSPYQFSKQVERTLEEYVRPMLQRDGGDLELVDIKDTLVYCQFRGACASCSGSWRTLQFLVERALKEQVDERIRVIAVKGE
jgi:NifU-like protein